MRKSGMSLKGLTRVISTMDWGYTVMLNVYMCVEGCHKGLSFPMEYWLMCVAGDEGHTARGQVLWAQPAYIPHPKHQLWSGLA